MMNGCLYVGYIDELIRWWIHRLVNRMLEFVLNYQDVKYIDQLIGCGLTEYGDFKMKFKFEDLEVWQLGMDLTDKIYDISKKYPDIERFNLTSQLISSVTSIPLNIAEGTGKSSKKDFAKYIQIAKSSLLETDTNLKIAIRRKYITEQDYGSIDENIKNCILN